MLHPNTYRLHRFTRALTLTFLLLAVATAYAATPVLGYKVTARYPHSTANYTEGFFYRDGLFYEGTSMSGPGPRTSALSTTASACASSNSSATKAKAGA